MEILEEKARREGLRREFSFTLRQRPVDLGRVHRHGKRAHQRNVRAKPLAKPAPPWMRAMCRTPPPSLSLSVPALQEWRVPEKLLYDFDILIKGSFESGRWNFNGNDLIIQSSPLQTMEVQTLHDFIGNLDNGSVAADTHVFIMAGSYWKKAFINIETLVQGQYHDIIPNLIQKINDLTLQKRGDLANLLRSHVANCCKKFVTPVGPTSTIYRAFGELEMVYMVEIGERIMRRFTKLFGLYLGDSCYNSFVKIMDSARRRLLQYPWTTFDDCLPPISSLDANFGPTDRRCMDVISLRAEVLSKRNMFNEAEIEAFSLIQRADLVQNDEWQRFYNLTRGWYFLGCAQYALDKGDVAVASLLEALRCDEEICKIADFHIFTPEKTMILKYLDLLRGAELYSP